MNDRLDEDIYQQAWLNVFQFLRENEISLPPAATIEEFDREYKKYLGLMYQHYGWAARTKYRTKGREIALEDVSGKSDHERVESWATVEDLLRDERLRSALVEFIKAWILQENGERIPNKTAKKLVTYRKQTKLPLKLERGRRS